MISIIRGDRDGGDAAPQGSGPAGGGCLAVVGVDGSGEAVVT